MNISQINIKDYYYKLPDEKIAQYPVKNRDESKLLIYNKGNIIQDSFRNIPEYLPADSLLVFNNTRVISARLLFRKESGAWIEVLCLEPLRPSSYESSFSSRGSVEWKCMVGNLKKWKRGILLLPFKTGGRSFVLSALRTAPEGESWRIRFSWEPDDLTFGEVITGAGHLPLPPYIRREDNPEDYIRYQTVYSSVPGSVAAPTAGLHFTENILKTISNSGIKSVEITLHVGAGTFQPVKNNNLLEHKMHHEYYTITEEAIKKILESDGRIIPVGTTSVRTLESIYWLGIRCALGDTERIPGFFTGQWEPYVKSQIITFRESLENLLGYMSLISISRLDASTGLIIVPGYEFKAVRGMITNFHQPGSTLLLLVAAYTGERWKDIYRFAMENGFRFLSYGDTSLLLG